MSSRRQVCEVGKIIVLADRPCLKGIRRLIYGVIRTAKGEEPPCTEDKFDNDVMEVASWPVDMERINSKQWKEVTHILS
jgi:hypothetical protein